MQSRRPLFAAVVPALIAGLFLAGCGETAGGSAVTYGSESVSVQEFQDQLRSFENNPVLNPSGEPFPAAQRSALAASQVGNTLVTFVAKARLAEVGASVTPDDRTQAKAAVIADFDEQTQGQGQAAVSAFPVGAQNRLIDDRATLDAAIATFATESPEQYFERNRAQLEAQCPTKTLLRAIPAQSAADAARIEAQLNAGTAYETALRAAAPDADPARFEIGCYQAGQVGEPAAEAVLAKLGPGQRAVVQVQGMFYVVDAQAFSSAAVARQVEQQQLGEARTAFGAYVEQQLTAVRPQVNPRFAVLTFSVSPDGKPTVDLQPAGGAGGGAGPGGAPRIREMPPTTTAPSPFGAPISR